MTISRKKRQFLIASVDTTLLFLSLYLSLLIRDLQPPSFDRFYRHFGYFIPEIVVWIACCYTAGLYSLELPYTGYRLLSRLSIVTILCTLFGFAFFYLNLNARVVPKTILVIYGLVSMSLIALWRWLFNRIAVKYIASINIAFIGMNSTVVDLLKAIQNFSYLSYKVMFLFDENYRLGDGIYHNIPVITNPVVFVEEIKKSKVQMVVVAREEKLPWAVHNVLFEFLQDRVVFIDMPDFYEAFMRRIPLDAVNELWFLRSIDLRSKNVYRLLKRIMDVVMAVLFLAVTLPFWPFIMLLIKLESPGPVFFKQERVGYLGRPFTIIKFRTMRVDNNTQGPAVRDDARITGMGKLLRGTRIDEIPQFLNIITFDMSFIGPRPERPELIQELERELPFYRQRLLVKPGLSGWDQVSGEYHSPSREDTYKKLQYDLYYIKNMSFFLDVSIFFKTLVTIVKRSGV